MRNLANVKVSLNRAGVRELLRSEEMKSICMNYANNALSRLPDGYEVTAHTGTNRVNAEVKAETLQEETILRIIQFSRGKG